MARLDLITGMRGAGKSVFAWLCLKYLKEQGHRPYYGHADFGGYDIDGFRSVQSPDGWRLCEKQNSPRRILAALPRAAKGCDRLVLECNRMLTRGEYESLFAAPELAGCKPGSVIAVVRAQDYSGLCAEPLHYLFGILESPGLVAINNMDVTPAQVRECREELCRMMRARLGSGVWAEKMAGRILEKAWAKLEEADYHRILHAPPVFFEDYLRGGARPCTDITLCPAREFTADELKRRLWAVELRGPGTVLRIKGCLHRRGGGSYRIDWTENGRSIRAVAERERPGLVVVGFSLDRDSIARTFSGQG